MEQLGAQEHAWVNTVIGAIGIGGAGAFLRERRKGRKDAGKFALDFIDRQDKRYEAQNLRIDTMNVALGKLAQEVETLQVDKARLLAENLVLRTEVVRLTTEVTVEKAKALALTTHADNRSAGGRSTDEPSV